jgi:hypothetical protein
MVCGSLLVFEEVDDNIFRLEPYLKKPILFLKFCDVSTMAKLYFVQGFLVW